MELRVFLVEDLYNLVALLEEMTQAVGGMRVVGTATTEADANAWLAQNQGGWDVAVIDPVLDEGSGLEVIRRSKADPRAGSIVVFSSFATPGVREHCLRLGADAVFPKGETAALIGWLDEQVQKVRHSAF